MHSITACAVLSALTFSSVTFAAAARKCSTTNVCFSVAVPSSSASLGTGNIYLQLTAPTTYSWIAMGQGQQMSGSNMFVMYQDGNGNVTISPRAGTQHTMPTEDTSSTAAKLVLLAGSGVTGNTMTANVMCANCQSWGLGSMSLTSTSSSWISAWKGGSSLASMDKNEAISQHDEYDIWNVDLTQATVSTDTNPYVASSGSSTPGNGTGSANTDLGSSNGISENQSFADVPRLISAHGVIMGVTFVILFPLGSILMPLMGNWILHAAWQFVTFILMWVGFGLGVVASQRTRINFRSTHTVFGTVIVCLMILQPAMGYLHHVHYVKHLTRGHVSYAHIVYGRILMMLGVINGGLGLQLASARNSLVVAYAVVSAIIFVVYVVVKGFTSFKKRRNVSAASRSRIPGGRKEGYSPQGNEMELPRRPYGSQRHNGAGY